LSVVGHGRLDLAVGGKPPQSCPRALQRAVDRRDRRLENVGRLLSGPAKDVAKQQGRALARRQLLDRRDEGELDRLTCLVARLRAWREIADVVERGVGVRLEPGDLLVPFAEWRERHGRTLRLRQHAPGLRAGEGGEARVGRDAIEPGARRRAPLESLKPAPRAQKRLLSGVLRVVQRAKHPIAVEQDLSPVALGELVERLSRIDSGLFLHDASLAHTLVSKSPSAG